MKSDMRLRVFGILVTVVFCLIAPKIAPGQTLSLYDDFSGGQIDSTKWQNLDIVREIRDGKLVSTLRVAGPPGTPENNLSFINPLTIQSFQADVRLNAYTAPPGGHVKMRLEGSYYNDGTGGPGDMTGDVLAQLYTLGDSTGVTIQYRVLKCLTPTCGGLNGATVLVGPTTVKPAALGEVHTLAISWNGSVFTFTVDGMATVVDPKSAQQIVHDAPNVPFKLLQSNVVIIGAGGEGYVTGDFDNVYVNGNLYDNFDGAPYSGPHLDPARWRDLEFVREIQNGRLASKVAHTGAANSYTQSNFHFANEGLVTSVKADVRVTEFSSADSAVVQATVFFGYVYNDGSSTGASDGTGDVYALFRVMSNNGGPLNVSLEIARFNGSTDIQFFSDTVATVNVGEIHTIFLTWNGSVFTYGITDLGISKTFDPTIKYPVVKPAVQHLKRLRTRASMNSDNGYGYIATTFDNVFVNDQAMALPGLVPFRQESVTGDVVTAGVGLRGTGSGTINLTGIPPGATVQKAYLYWATMGGSGTYTSPTLNGMTVSGTLIGRSDDPWWGIAQSFAYRADVTNLISGNGTYTVAGLPAGPLPPANLTVSDSEGASLVVIYSLPGAPARVITINDGAVTLSGSRVQYYATALGGFNVVDAPTGAHAIFLVGDGQSFTPEYAGLNTTLLATNEFSGSDGNYWDTRTYNISTAQAVGPNTATAIVSTASDSLVWVAAILSVPGTPAPSSLLTVSKSGTGAGNVTSTPAGITCPGDCTETYARNTTVTLTASAGTNSAFYLWGGACTGILTTTCTVAMDSAKTVTVMFGGPTDTAAGLGVFVSGPGRVTSGDGRIDCPGSCIEMYGKNTSVTLTAIPEGGGTFRGWSGACGGPQAMCMLTLDTAKGVTAVFTGTEPPAAGLALYDDFNATHLDPARWVAPRESLRVIQNGALLLAHRAGSSSDNNLNTQVHHASPPTNLTSIQADVTLSNATIPVAGAWNRLRLRGAFYKDGTPGTGALGDVYANAGLRLAAGGTPEAWWSTFRCADADCNTTTNKLDGSLGPVALNQTYTVRIAWNGSQFTFRATPVGGGTPLTLTVTPPVAVAGPPRKGDVRLRAEVTAWPDSPGVLDGYTQGTFDNVSINGSTSGTLYDDFSSGTIDPAKWTDFEWGRTLQGGALVLNAQAPANKNTYTSIRVPNPTSVTDMAVDMAFTARSLTVPQDVAHAGLQGAFYNTGTGTLLGDVHGQIYYWTSGDGTVSVHFNTWRSDNAGQFITLFGETLASGLALGEVHRLRLGWDGAVFTYGVDNLLRTFDPRPLAPVVRAPVNPSREVYAQAGAASGGRASLTATVENLWANPEAVTALPSLRPFRTVRLAGDVATTGVGLRGTGAGTISLSALPTNASVQQAWLYWATLGSDGTFTSPTLNGTPVEGVLIGQGDDPNAGACQSYAYRADVTSLVTGNGSHVIAGLPADGPTVNDTEGASLVVLYTVPGAPVRQVAISDGLATLNSSNTLPARLLVASAPFAGLEAVNPAGASLTLLVGDGEVSDAASRDFAGLNATLLTPSADAFTGSAGSAWDALTLDASPALTAGTTDAAAVLSTWGNGLVWVAALLSTPLQSPALSVTLAGPGTGTVTSSPAGLNCPSDCSQAYPSGTLVTLTVTAGSGSSFAGWGGTCSGTTGTCTVTVDAAKTVTATFGKAAATTAILSLSLSGPGTGSVTSNPAGITCPGDCTESYPLNTSVTLTASAGANSAFYLWGGACTGILTATCIVAMDSAKAVTVMFGPGGPAATAAGLAVTVSGPGRVTSGDGRIDCPGNCTEMYGKDTSVTLTAIPEGGGTFRGWYNGPCGGPQAMCTLTLDTAKSVTAVFAGSEPAPADLGLYDDFSSTRLDPAKWTSVREQVREIRDGKLFLAAGGSAPTDNSANTPLRYVNPPPTNLTSLQADLRLTDATPPGAGGYSRMRIRAAFYNDGTSGTVSLGDVWAQAGLRVYPTGAVELYWGYYRCDDADCNSSPTGETGVLGPAELNKTYTVSIAWDATANAGTGQFTFTATPEGGTAITSTRTPIITPKGSPRTGHLMLRTEVTTWANSPGIEGYTAGTFDNVRINDTLYDAFNGPAIDPTKWRDYEVVRELASGALVQRSVTPAGTSNRWYGLRLVNPNAVTNMAADVAVTERTLATSGEWGQTGLHGVFYNTGSGTTGGDVNARTYYQANGDGTLRLEFNLYRNDGPQYIGLFTDTLATGLTSDESHRLRLAWDGAVFTYGVDNLVRTFDPRPLAPVGQPPVNPVKELYITSGSAGQRAAVTAIFDNVAVNPEALAALPGLHPRETRLLAGDVAAAGVGLRGTGAGTLNLTTLPIDATVTEAILYWATLGLNGTFTSPTLNGTPITGMLIGQGDDPIGGVFQSYAYRADVTSLVWGNGSYVIAGLPADGPTLNDTEGASLVVFYTVPGAPLRQVAVSDGLATVTYNMLGTATTIPIPSRLPAARAPFAGLRAIDPAGAKLLLLAGDGQPSGTFTRDYAGLDGTLLASDPFTGSDGAAWDTKSLDASSGLTAGATTATAVVSTLADSVVWVAALLSTPLQSPALSVTLAGPGTGTVTSSPAGLNCPSDCSQAYPSGTLVTLTVTAGSGSSFAGWGGTCSGTTGTCTVTVDAAKTVTATFAKATATTATLSLSLSGLGTGSVTSSPAGITCPGDCTESYALNTSVTLTASAGANSAFYLWGGACTGILTATCIVAMDSAKAVTVMFGPGGPAATAAGLAVTVSGPGRVTSGDGKIDCPGSCTEMYGKNTSVTLTAIPEGGGTFRGWYNGPCGGPQAICTLTLDQAKAVTAVFAGSEPAPPGLTLYDDFSATHLDPTRWASIRESVREIRDGVLFLAHRGAAASSTNTNTQINHVSPPTTLTSFQADVTLSDATVRVAGAYNRMRFRGNFYNDGTVGTGSLGDVQAWVGLRVGTTGSPEAFYGIQRCADAGCNVTQQASYEYGALGPVDFNTPYTVRVAWTGSQFTFTATPVGGGTPLTLTVTPAAAKAGPVRSPGLTLRAEVSAWGSSPGVLDGYTQGTFDNVSINGATSGTLYDDFSSGTIDPAKWRDFEIERTLANGTLVLNARAPAGKSQYASLRVLNPNAVSLLAADVTLTARTLAGPQDAVHTGLAGTFYNTGTGTTLGDVNAHVFLWADADGAVSARFNSFRSGAGQFIQLFGETLATGLTLGETHRLLLGWDGAVFTYGVDGLLRTFDPRPLAPVGRAAVNPNREFYVNPGAPAVAGASLTATFDNVRVNPEAFSALPSLRPFRTLRLLGDVATTGVGLRGTGAGTLNLTLPANASVQQAFLYWATLGMDGTFTSPTLNGTPVEGVLIGQGDDPNVGARQSYAYRADVTSLIPGNGSYVIAGLPADGPTVNDTEGASLVVLYTVPGAPLRQVTMSDGLAALTSSRFPVAQTPFAGLEAVDPAGAMLTLLVGDGQVSDPASRDYAGLNATLLTPSGDAFTGSSGSAWDALTLDASSALTLGATDATAVLSTWGDSLVWVAALLSTTPQTNMLSVSLAGTGTGSVTSSPAGITCPGTCNAAYAPSTAVTLTATASDGFVFSSWTDCPSPNGNKCTVTMDQALSVGANFVPATYTLTVAIRGSSAGSVSGLTCTSTTCTGSFTNGTVVTLTPIAGPGGGFREWRDGCTGATCQVTMNGPKSVTAVFSKTYTNSTLTTGSPIKAVDFTELREAINSLRAHCVQCVPVLGAFAWTDTNLVAKSTPVKAAHLTELRTALGPVYRQKYGSDPTYTIDPSVVAGQTVIKVIHLNVLRQFVHDSE